MSIYSKILIRRKYKKKTETKPGFKERHSNSKEDLPVYNYKIKRTFVFLILTTIYFVYILFVFSTTIPYTNLNNKKWHGKI